MKAMKKVLSLLLALALCLCLAACGGAEEPIPPEDDPNEGLGGDLSEDSFNDFSEFEGIWLGEANNSYDSMEFDAEGNWAVYLGNEAVDYGYLRYEPEWEALYAYSSLDDSGTRIAIQDGQLYSVAYGYFNPGEDMEYLYYDDLTRNGESDVPSWNGRLDGASDGYWSWDTKLCQRNVSEFEGIWYLDGDLSAEAYLMIDNDGNWSWYFRTSGEEPEEIDCGSFTYSTDEVSSYYADSTMYDGLSYRVFEEEENILIWNEEGEYYRME